MTLELTFCGTSVSRLQLWVAYPQLPGLAPALAWASPLCCDVLSASGSLHCYSLHPKRGPSPGSRWDPTDTQGTQLTASRSRSMIVSSSSKCRSLISNFFIWVSTSRATRDLIFLSSTAAKC